MNLVSLLFNCLSGYCGADIRALCTEATLCALRRRYPQIYSTSQKLLLDVSSISVTSGDFAAAMGKMSPASQRSVSSPAKPLSPVVLPLLGAALRDILDAVHRLFPHAEQGMKRKREPGESELKTGESPAADRMVKKNPVYRLVAFSRSDLWYP